MHCGPNEFHGTLDREADAPSGVTAYDLAEAAATRAVRELVARFVAGLKCPGNCPNMSYRSSDLAINVARVDGYPSTKFEGQYHIRVRASYQFTVICGAPVEVIPHGGGTSPAEDPMPTPVPVPTPGPAVPVPVPFVGPCTVDATKHDASTRNGFGVFTWDLDVTITATATNPNHTFPPGSCRITELNFVNGTPASWTMAKAIGLTTDLMQGYGLIITPGAGVATVTGQLVPGVKGIAPMPGALIQLKGTAVDSNGDHKDFEFILQSPP